MHPVSGSALIAIVACRGTRRVPNELAPDAYGGPAPFRPPSVVHRPYAVGAYSVVIVTIRTTAISIAPPFAMHVRSRRR